jgi:hypothetical protein
MRHRLADSGHSRSFSCNFIQAQLQWWIISICFELPYDRSSTAYWSMQFGQVTA